MSGRRLQLHGTHRAGIAVGCRVGPHTTSAGQASNTSGLTVGTRANDGALQGREDERERESEGEVRKLWSTSNTDVLIVGLRINGSALRCGGKGRWRREDEHKHETRETERERVSKRERKREERERERRERERERETERERREGGGGRGGKGERYSKQRGCGRKKKTREIK